MVGNDLCWTWGREVRYLAWENLKRKLILEKVPFLKIQLQKV
jgi:hypothetical protein